MKYLEWDAIYCRIIDDFGYSRQEDEYAAKVLAGLVKDKRICGPDCLGRVVKEEVTVYGFGPNLEREMDKVEPTGTIISADGATAELLKRGLIPDLIVTDLDGHIDALLAANSGGAVAVIHAHGDNVQRMKEYIPFFSGRVTPTTQAKPFDRVYNFGGFTDGDRAVMLARHFGARRIMLIGFDFSSVRKQRGKDTRTKMRKLEWAHRLIYDLNPPKVSISTP